MPKKSRKSFKYNCACLVLIMPIFAQNTFAQTSQTSVWNSSEGRLTLNYDGSSFSGNYDNDGGRVSGNQSVNFFDGYWAEETSGKKCSYERLESYYWGKIHWEFKGNTFNGQYSYCDDPMSGSWNGSLIEGSPIKESQVYTPPQISANQGANSIWKSDEGRLHLTVNKTNFSGKYENDNGRVSGTRNNNILEGYWGEDSSGTRCSTERLNTYYWGKIRWVFSGNAFSGKYSYCDNDWSGSWNGTLESGSAFVNVPQSPPKPPIAKPIAPPPINVITSAWNTSEGTLNLVIKGQNVSGTYVNDNGRITGTKIGNTITGFWGEDSSGTKCTTKKLNTYYWGKIKWVFNGNSFSGQYSYCEGAMTGNWTGTKK